MDFIDYDTFDNVGNDKGNEAGLPEPAPPLVLPMNTDITNRFKHLSLLKKTFERSTSQSIPDTNDTNSTADNSISTAEKYAKLTIDLLDSSYQQNFPDVTDLRNNKHNSKSEDLLGKRISKVLNNYETNDPSLRDALKILQSRTDLDLKALIKSDLFGSMARRRFRSDIESELLKQHSSYLREFQPVVDKIEGLGSKINKLDDLSKQLNDEDKLNPQLITQIESLSKENDLLLLKKSLLLNFKKNFTLTQYEEHFLTNEEISLEFFQILSKCKSIHSKCSVLLSLENPQLGLTIMEKMNKFLDLSNQRLSFFLISNLDKFLASTNEDSYSLSSSKELKLLKISIFYLSNNLKYFDDIVNSIIRSRSKYIVDEFLYQLNNLTTTDHSRPIVLSAHDPLRYIGDILAYVHSVIVNEVEFTTGLFQINDNITSESFSEFERSLIQTEKLEDFEKVRSSVISKIIASLNKPLKIRVEQIIRSEPNTTTLVKIFNLLDLYKLMYHRQLPKDSDCSTFETLDSLKSLSSERVLALLKEQLNLIEKENESTSWKLDDDDSLLPPDWLRDSLNESLAIFDIQNDYQNNILSLKDEEFDYLTNLIVDKPISLIETQAKKNFGKERRSLGIFELNSLDLIESKVLPVYQLTTKIEQVSKLIYEKKTAFIKYQYETLLKNSGLDIHQQLIQLIFPIEQIETEDDYYMYSSLIENKIFGKDKIKEIEIKLHEFLPVALIEIQQSVFKISSPSIANDIISKSSLEFLKLYNVFYKVLEILYEDERFLEWSTYDVAALLGVEELYKETLV